MANRAELYRHYDTDGNLLYVGVSHSTIVRLMGHKCTSAWFDQITTIKIERFDCREDALRAERKAIETESPLHNVKNSLREIPQPPPVLLTLQQVAERMDIPKRTAYNQLKRGDFPIPHLPRTKPRKWSSEAVDAWLRGEG